MYFQNEVLVSEDYVANNEKELSIVRGQKVEILDHSPGGATTDWCLVRLVNTEDGTTGLEGLVPASAVKHQPNLRISASNDKIENDGR